MMPTADGGVVVNNSCLRGRIATIDSRYYIGINTLPSIEFVFGNYSRNIPS